MMGLRKLGLGILLVAVIGAAFYGGVQLGIRMATPKFRISPIGTATLELGDAGKIVVTYGRPYVRTRKIFGALVPWGQVWRTGANEATSLSTPVDLAVGGAAVPAGHYTLYTLPSADSWLLIVNRMTGQWGTVYDASQDLVRVPMTVEHLDDLVEQFTIRFEPPTGDQTPDTGDDDGAGVAVREARLALEWENTRASVDLEIGTRP